MPTPLSSSSSQEIFPISPPLGSASTSKRRRLDPSATTLPKPKTFVPKGNLRDAVLDHLKAQEKKETSQGRKARTMSFIPGVTDVKSETSEARRISPRGKRKAEESSPGSMSRTQVTNRMVRQSFSSVITEAIEELKLNQISTLGKDGNAITNSDLYSRCVQATRCEFAFARLVGDWGRYREAWLMSCICRTDHFVSAATGHQQSNRGGGSSGAMTYWAVRTAKMEEQAREKVGSFSEHTRSEAQSKSVELRSVQKLRVLSEWLDRTESVESAGTTSDHRKWRPLSVSIASIDT